MMMGGRSTLLRLTKIKEGRREKEWEEHLKNGVGGKISHAEDDKDKGREEKKRVGKTPQEWCWWEDQPCCKWQR
jgi:hypothetical protein